MSRGIFKIKKYKKTEVETFEASIKRVGNEYLDCVFGEKLVEYNVKSYFLDEVEKRIKSLNLSRRVRKDAVYMVDILITADSDFFKGLTTDKTGRFFQECIAVLCRFFGGAVVVDRAGYDYENVVSAAVNKKNNPVLHFCFVPVTPEGRLSAKNVLSREVLLSLRNCLKMEVWDSWGLGVDIEPEFDNIRNENDPIRTKKEKNRCVDAEFMKILAENSHLEGENLLLELDKFDLSDENKILRAKLKDFEMETSLLRQSFDFLLQEYVGGMDDVDSLPDSAGKESLLELKKFYDEWVVRIDGFS